MKLFFFFFFFQAEDGIRDYKVTGVQTCALPISAGSERDDHAHGPLRPLLRRGVGRAEEPCGGDGEQAASRKHQLSSLFPPSARGGEPSDARPSFTTWPMSRSSHALYKHLAGPATNRTPQPCDRSKLRAWMRMRPYVAGQDL